MIRKAFRMAVNPGQHAEYERRHTPIGPELEQGLRVATVDFGGWDTHENQASGSNSATGTFATRVTEVSDALNAFWRDIASYHGKVTIVAEYDGEPNGLKIHRDGRIFIADHKHGLLLLDPASGKVSTILDRPYRERFKGLNDLIFARNGDLYFTDQGESDLRDPAGRLYRLGAEGLKK